MVPSLDLLAVLNLLGAGQGLLLALALATVKRGDRAALAQVRFLVAASMRGASARGEGPRN
ncbi:MAG TPA: hypothetical protein VD968_20040 [Pyrinomonadaceae bacterium]|nr:hypothetical protein [Pyrinomonadaceae bacterium]